MKKIFTNDRFFLAMTLCAVIGGLSYFVIMNFCMPNGYILSQLPLLIEALGVLFLYSSYRKHSKNVMKGMMGAILMAQLIAAISFFSALYLQGEGLVASINFALSALIFITHFIINSDHHSKPGWIKLNQVLCFIYLVDNLAWLVLWIIADQSLSIIACSVADMVFCMGVVTSVVCVESRLDAYRIEREANGYQAE